MIDKIATCYFSLQPIPVLHLEKWLAILNGELHQHCAHPGHIAMHWDVVAEDLGEDHPVLWSFFNILWHALTLPWIARFYPGFVLFSGNLIVPEPQ